MFIFLLPLAGFAKVQKNHELLPAQITKGSCSLLKVLGESYPAVSLDDKKIVSHYLNGANWAFLCVALDDPRRTAMLRFQSNLGTSSMRVTFNAFNYRKRYLVIPEDKKKYVGASKEKDAARAKAWNALQKSSASLYIRGNFSYPVVGMNNADLFYGDYRQITKGKSVIRYFHRGLDYGAQIGEPVVAPNDGMVVMAQDLFSRGKTIFLDHGWGIFSEYLHLDEILVTEGQFVHKGDLIGRVGNTGVSTGAHLHWGIYVKGHLVNPHFFINYAAQIGSNYLYYDIPL